MLRKENSFSIIIPVYNGERHICNCLNSIREQNYKNYEIIIVDDGSKDLTKTKIFDYKERYPEINIQYFYQNNSGAGLARAKAIENSKMDYVAFLDADDIWYKNKLFEVNEILNQNNNIDFIYHDEYEIDLKGTKKIQRYRKLSGDIMEDIIVNGNPISTSTVVIEKKILLKSNTFKLGKRHGEDIECWVEVAKNKGNFYYLPKILGEYRRETSSLTLKSIEFTKDTNKVLLELYNNLENKYSIEEIEKMKKRRKALNKYNEARFYHKTGDFKQAKICYKESLNLKMLKIYIGLILTVFHIKY